MIALKEQAPHQIVDIAPFPKEYEVYPEGARAKASFVLPRSALEQYPFCTPSRMYLFKTSRGVYPEQFWVEIFAYQLGCLIGVPVPPAFVARDSKEGKAGALIEWFYNQNEDRYMRGGDAMTAMINNYDRVRGGQHNLQTIFEFVRPLKWGSPGWTQEWAKILIFDALIGNSDRHQENWGIITQYGLLDEATRKRRTKAKILESSMSPAFDNGTSMGHEIMQNKFQNFKFEKYVNNGKPHMLWDISVKREQHINHENFIKKYAFDHEKCRETMLGCLQFSEAEVRAILQRLMSFDIQPRLSSERAEFMLKLLMYRLKILKLALES